MSVYTEITRINNAKANIKTAIESKGVSVPSAANIDTYSSYVAQIQVGKVDSVNGMVGDVTIKLSDLGYSILSIEKLKEICSEIFGL